MFSVDSLTLTASCQLQDFLLHETAMAWMRDRLKKTAPKKPWKETLEALLNNEL